MTTARTFPGGPPGSPDAEGDRFIEIWNLVFMQYEQVAAGERVDLPRPSIDTGMGLERIAAVLQGTHDNYAIDLFGALIQAVADETGVDATGPQQVSHRVIADHLRASSFLIADGVLPSNEGRGYVLRRIMRRAMRHAELLGAKDPVMWKLVPVLVREMGTAYPELIRAEALITETLRLEERRFRKTLERGLAILDEETKNLSRGGQLSGETAFTLYDTYGFPLDLTQDALKSRGIGVDTTAFDAAMARQRELARASWTGSGEAKTDTLWFALRDKVGATDFLGYETEDARRRGAGTGPRRHRGRAPEQGRKRIRGAQPDAVLRRVRRTSRRHRHHACGRRARARHRHAEDGGRRLRPQRHRRGRRAAPRRGAGARRRSRAAQRISAPTTPPPTCCTRRCARCWAITWRRRARWSRPTGCASISPIPSRWTTPRSPRSRTSPTRRCCATPR